MANVTIYLPDDLAQEVRSQGLNVSSVCQRALRTELARHQRKEGLMSNMRRIEVELWRGEQPYTAAFTGSWLVIPDSDETRTEVDGYDAGTYWGVALTERGRIAVYTADVNDRWAPSLNVYDSLTEAAADSDIPEDVLAIASAELGDEHVVELDI